MGELFDVLHDQRQDDLQHGVLGRFDFLQLIEHPDQVLVLVEQTLLVQRVREAGGVVPALQQLIESETVDELTTAAQRVAVAVRQQIGRRAVRRAVVVVGEFHVQVLGELAEHLRPLGVLVGQLTFLRFVARLTERHRIGAGHLDEPDRLDHGHGELVEDGEDLLFLVEERHFANHLRQRLAAAGQITEPAVDRVLRSLRDQPHVVLGVHDRLLLRVVLEGVQLLLLGDHRREEGAEFVCGYVRISRAAVLVLNGGRYGEALLDVDRGELILWFWCGLVLFFFLERRGESELVTRPLMKWPGKFRNRNWCTYLLLFGFLWVKIGRTEPGLSQRPLLVEPVRRFVCHFGSWSRAGSH